MIMIADAISPSPFERGEMTRQGKTACDCVFYTRTPAACIRGFSATSRYNNLDHVQDAEEEGRVAVISLPTAFTAYQNA